MPVPTRLLILPLLLLLLASGSSQRLPEGARVQRELRYGADPAQALDVYFLPADPAARRPVIVMVHGGAWAFGDKDHRGLVDAKVRHWLPRGNVFVSINYRMLPAHPVSVQADDVARALAYVQRRARDWGGDPDRVVLVGHSAGAHLVALLSADPARARAQGAKPWPATVALDSAALDVTSVMQRRHLPLYDRAFGADPAGWRRLSPRHALVADAVPVLAVCSSTRRDEPCAQARAYSAAARALGVAGAALPWGLDHAGINRELGVEENYTAAVDRFIADRGAGPRMP